MLDLRRGNSLLTDLEVLDNITEYVKNNVGSQDWREHLYMVAGYVAAGIGWHEQEVNGFFNAWLNLNGGK